MRKIKKLIIIYFLFTLQSCLFGAGLIEEKISDNIYLTAINSYDELSIWHSLEGTSIRNLLVPETVFAVGYNDDFIIVKSHPKNNDGEINKKLTYYHIIEIKKVSNLKPEQTISMLKDQFEHKCKVLGIYGKLDFDIIISQNE